MKKLLRLFVLMTTLFMVSLSLHTLSEMKMESMDDGTSYELWLDVIGNRPVVLIDDNEQLCMLQLQELCPHYRWSKRVICLCDDMRNGGNVVLHERMKEAVEECLRCCAQEMVGDRACKNQLEMIQESLQEYQKFLSSPRSLLDARAVLFSKKKCCRKSCASCFTVTNSFTATNCATCVVVDGNNITAYLPTGPITPVTDNFFYATKQGDQGIVLPTTFTPVVFNTDGFNDGNWVLSGSNFTAQHSGTYLVTINIPYNFTGETTGGENVLFLSPYLNGNPIASAAQVYIDYLNIAQMRTLVGSANFIVSVNANDVLTIQNRQDVAAGTDSKFSYQAFSPVPPQWNNGSITIVRIR